MAKLTLWYPAKPFHVTQGWGISNPSYNQFGFSKHNGVDFKIGDDKLLRSPTNLVVAEVGFNESAGNFVRLFSPEKLEIGDQECYLGAMFMHLERAMCAKGQLLETGEVFAVPDNTGFSTGPHTHMTLRRYSKQVWNKKYQLDLDPASDFTFDPAPYWTGFYAKDKDTVINLLQQVLKLLLSKKR